VRRRETRERAGNDDPLRRRTLAAQKIFGDFRGVKRSKSRIQPDGCINDATRRAVAYVRVSKESQLTQGVSLEAQTERVKAYCTLQSLELVRIVTEDGESAGKRLEERPGGAEVLRTLKHDARHLIVMKLDRLFRNATDALIQSEAWDQAGIGLHVMDMGGAAIDTRSAMGRFFFSITAAYAEMERRQIGERTAIALQHKRRHRRAYAPTPYGLRREGASTRYGKDGAAELETETFELAILKQLQMLRAQGWTLQELANGLNTRKIPTKRGGRQWWPSTVAKILDAQAA
jgi:DNA invertase Pin-like site-specific DNA recombinase